VAKVSLMSTEQLRRLLDRFSDMINPKRYYVVTDREAYLVLVPVKTSRHTHYYELASVKREDLENLLAELERRGFTIIEGSVTFLPG